MYFIIFKPNQKDKFTSFTNQIFTTEEEADGFAKRSLKKKDVWKVVLYDKENYDKFWYK